MSSRDYAAAAAAVFCSAIGFNKELPYDGHQPVQLQEQLWFLVVCSFSWIPCHSFAQAMSLLCTSIVAAEIAFLYRPSTRAFPQQASHLDSNIQAGPPALVYTSKRASTQQHTCNKSYTSLDMPTCNIS